MTQLSGDRKPFTVAALGAVLLLCSACGSSGPDTSFFTIRPVTRQTSPPCVAPALGHIPLPDGQVVSCYELGPTAVDAGDVNSAKVVVSPSTTLSDVEFGLSPAGLKRWTALARAVGVGGQIAIVVDGAVASAPRLGSVTFAGKGLVTGLDAAVADRLAKRLNHG